MALPPEPKPMDDAEFDADLQDLIKVQASFQARGFNIVLMPDQSRELSVPATRMKQYVENAFEALGLFATSIPADFPAEHFTESFKTFKQASTLEDRLEALREGAHFTAMLSGASSKGYSDQLYALLQGVGKYNAIVKSWVDENLAPYYEKPRRNNSNPESS